MKTRGIHWIVTTHGSWLHGDPRGSWRDGKLLGPDPFLESAVRHRLRDGAVVLDTVEQLLVTSVWGACVVEMNLRVYAATVAPTHAHVVFAPMQPDVSNVIATLKRRSAEKVNQLRRQRRGEVPKSVWTKHPFAMFIFNDDHLLNAVRYVRDHNHRAGRAADPYAWISPLENDGQRSQP